MNILNRWARKSWLKGEIDTIKMKLEFPGALARIPNWRENLEGQLRDKEEEMYRLENEF